MDRAVQDKAFEPLLHVVRNAVGHGIESPADRVRAGKPATGCVTLEARREGNTLVIVVGDDGKGLDDEAIADKARQLGWLGPDETAQPRATSCLPLPARFFHQVAGQRDLRPRGGNGRGRARGRESSRDSRSGLAARARDPAHAPTPGPARPGTGPDRAGRRPAPRGPGIAGRTCPAVRTSRPEPRRTSRGGQGRSCSEFHRGHQRDLPRSGHPGGLRPRDARNRPLVLGCVA